MSIKGYELMKLVADDPEKYEGKKYELKDGSILDVHGKVAYDAFIEQGILYCNRDLKAYISAKTTLEEIKQPVTPQEAAKAYMEGKCIIYEFEGVKTAIIKGASGKIYSQDYFMTLIATGIWYIED